MTARMVVFGASGDLTSRLLMPAVAQLAAAGLLPEGLSIVGASTTSSSTEDFREHIAAGLDEHADVPGPVRDAVLGMLGFQTADVTSAADVRRVVGEDHPDTLVYLALPTALLPSALPALATTGLSAGDGLAIEKPFGTDLASARQLNELLHTRLPGPAVFRVDHFLSDELVQRLLALRFLNRVFEPVWNATHVERVDVSWSETLTLEGRAGYYDRAGALRDMVQNHLMEVMALVLMEPPARLDADSFRDVRVEALRSVATPAAGRLRETTARARYTAGTIGRREVPAYVHEPGVDPGRGTETHASVVLEVDSARWAGVPVTLRSGKAQPDDSAEVAVHFRPLPRFLRDRWPDVAPNVLRLGLREPYVRLGTTLNGSGRTVVAHQLEARSPRPRLSAYAHLVGEMLRRESMLFVRGDEAEEAWRIVDPVARAWAAGEVPMQEYVAGTAAPGTSS